MAGYSKKESAPASGAAPAGKQSLAIWSFVEDTRRMLKFYEPDHPDVTVDFNEERLEKRLRQTMETLAKDPRKSIRQQREPG
jgi:hypothetical protein